MKLIQCMLLARGRRLGCKNSSVPSSVHFSSSFLFGTARASSLSESKSLAGRSKSSAQHQKQNGEKLASELRAWDPQALYFTVPKVVGAPLVVHEIEQLRRLEQMRDKPPILHGEEGFLFRGEEPPTGRGCQQYCNSRNRVSHIGGTFPKRNKEFWRRTS